MRTKHACRRPLLQPTTIVGTRPAAEGEGRDAGGPRANRRGFTLIELLIMVTLSALLLGTYLRIADEADALERGLKAWDDQTIHLNPVGVAPDARSAPDRPIRPAADVASPPDLPPTTALEASP